MAKPGDLGIRLDREEKYRSVVKECSEDSAGYQGGLRVGDVIHTVNGIHIGSPLNYDFMRFDWISGEVLEVEVLRDGMVRKLDIIPRAVYPGTLGVQCVDTDKGIRIDGFDYLSDAPRAGIKLGDVLTGIDGKSVKTKGDLGGIPLRAGERVDLRLLRKDQTFNAELICAPVAVSDFGVSFVKVDKSADPGTKINSFSGSSCLASAGLKKR